MNTVKRYTKLLPATARIGRIQLPQALVALGMTNVGSKQVKYGNGRLMLSKLNEWQLGDLYRQARSLYLHLVIMLHPDKGGPDELCARLNALWARIEFLFERKGITV
jgi:hypothetical protein